MVKSLLLVWLVGVIAFFVLWALLAQVVRRISEKRRTEHGERNGETLNEAERVKLDLSEEEDKKPAPESDASED